MIRGRLSASALQALLGDWQAGGAVYEALAERIRLLLIDGRITADVRLPSERELGDRLALSRTTITAAYRRLREDGYARSVQGSGTTTSLPSGRPAPQPGGELLDLTKATLPATRLFPDAARSATEQLMAEVGGHGYHPIGVPALRQAVADRYTDRGLPTRPEQILVTSGAQAAIALLARTLSSRGERAYAESPSYPHAYDALRLAGARVVTSPVTADGWDMAALEATIGRTDPVLGYVMPEFQNPTSRSMTADDRERLLRAAARVDMVVLADETNAELDIDAPSRYEPLAATATRFRARVVHIGSASKLLWGGLRIGWIRAEEELIARLATDRLATDLGTPVWDQLVAAELLRHVPAIVAERRDQLAAGRATLYQTLPALLPGWRLPDAIHGGLAAWVGLPMPASSQLTLAARSRGVLVTAGPRFGADGAFERHLRLPITATPAELRHALQVLAAVWPQVAGATTGSALETVLV